MWRSPLLMLLLAGIVCSTAASAYSTEPQDTERQRAFELWEKSNFTESIPILEKIAATKPDVEVLSRLGFALYATSITIQDKNVRRKQLDRARAMLLKAQQMGDNSNLTQITLDALSSSDEMQIPFSAIQEADAAMREGEAAFVRGELDKALAGYERALKLDPRLYDAALYAGDMYFKKGYTATDPKTKNELLAKAGEWFAKAISIDPDRETAYRYWGDALMLQKKTAEARDKFVEAIVAEPYGRRSYVGLTQWADQVGAQLAHPEIKQPPPTMRSSQTGNETTITIDPKTLDPKQGRDNYWTLYDLIRSTYKVASFKKDHPNEQEYRHSLKEEASALMAVAEAVSNDLKSGKLKQPDASLNNLIKLWDSGLIESYVLFARASQEIAQDYAPYRRGNRPKLKQYWLDFVIREK